MSEDKGHLEEFIHFIIIFVAVIAVAIYGVFIFWPYFVYYLLPFILGSLVVGGMLRIAVRPNVGESAIINYKGLAKMYPFLILLVGITFFADPQRAVVIDKKDKVVGTYLDWPEVNKAFNENRSSVYASSPFDSLKAKAKDAVIYDRQELGWIALWCLFLGGPLFFGFLSRGDIEENAAIVNQVVNKRVEHARERLKEKEDKLDATIKKTQVELQEKIKKLESDREIIMAENLRLKATVEFSQDIPRSVVSVKTSGVLDQDIL